MRFGFILWCTWELGGDLLKFFFLGSRDHSFNLNSNIYQIPYLFVQSYTGFCSNWPEDPGEPQFIVIAAGADWKQELHLHNSWSELDLSYWTSIFFSFP